MSGDDDGGGLKFMRKLGVPQGMDALVLTFGLSALWGIAFAAYWFGVRIRVARGGMPDEAYVVRSWGPDGAIAVDVDADGQEDVVGMFVGDPRGRYIGAFSGRDKKPLWRFGPIDVETSVGAGLPQFGLQGDKLLVNQKRKGTVLNLQDGKATATFALPNARLVCAGETRTSPLLLATSYAENTLQVDLASGTQAAVKGRRLCQRVTAQARQIDHAELAELASHKQSWALVDGVSVVGLAHGPGAVPTLHGYAGQPREAKWQSVLLPSVKAGVLIVGADYADIAAGRAFVGYWHTSDRKPWVLALDASSGKELWRAPIDSPGSTLTSVSASATRVYVIVGDFLVVFDAASGKVVLDFGTGDSD